MSSTERPAPSSSMMVPSAVWATPSMRYSESSRVSRSPKCSTRSERESSTIGTEMVVLRRPAPMVAMPVTAVKSSVAVASLLAMNWPCSKASSVWASTDNLPARYGMVTSTSSLRLMMIVNTTSPALSIASSRRGSNPSLGTCSSSQMKATKGMRSSTVALTGLVNSNWTCQKSSSPGQRRSLSTSGTSTVWTTAPGSNTSVPETSVNGCCPGPPHLSLTTMR